MAVLRLLFVMFSNAERTLPGWRAAPVEKIETGHRHRAGVRLISVTGALLTAGYIAYFFLMQAHPLWQSPTLLQDHWKNIFYPIANLFPVEWTRAPRFSGNALIASVLYIFLLAALFAVYFAAVRRFLRADMFRAESGGLALRRILAFTFAALAILMVVPGVLSTDLMSYIWYGRIFVVYGDSPFTHVPADYTWIDTDNWRQWLFWKETPSVYGPLWVLMAGGIAKVAQGLGGDIVFHLLGHKLVASAAHFVNVLLVWRVAGLLIDRFRQRPEKLAEGMTEADWAMGARVAATVAYAWNPLIMLEFGANGHNDVLMITGVLAALWLYMSGHWRFALVALALAAQAKFIAVLLVPGFLWLLFWQAAEGNLRSTFFRRVSPAIQGAAIYLATCVFLYLPFWEGTATLKPLVTGPPVEFFVNSLGFLLRFKLPEGVHNLAQAFGWQPAEFWTTAAIGDRVNLPARWGPTLIFMVAAVLLTWNARTLPRMIAAWGWIFFVYLTVGAVWFWPWYVSWVLAIAVLAGPGRLLTGTMILTCTSMILYGTYWRGSTEAMSIADWRPLVMVLPPLLYVLGSWWHARRRRPATETPRQPEGGTVPSPVPAAPGARYAARPRAVAVPPFPSLIV